MRLRRITDFPDELLIRISEWAAYSGRKPALVSLALVSRAINRAATQILYRTIVLRGLRQPRVLLAMLEACETNGTYSPPLLRLVHNFSTYGTSTSSRARVARIGLVARIVDACPHIQHLRTTVELLNHLCVPRGYESLFVQVEDYPADWTSFAFCTQLDFTPFRRLHLDFSFCSHNLFGYLYNFSSEGFPNLAYVSAQGYELGNAPFFVALAEELLVLPNFKRFVLWVPCYVDDFPETYRPAVMALCKLKDDRVCIAEGIDDVREFPMWKTYVEHRADPWDYGKPVAQLL